MKKVFVSLVIILAAISMVAMTTPQKAEALSVSDVGEFVVELPDKVFEGIVSGVRWTVDKFIEACDAFAACDWAKDRIVAVVDWLNESCNSFAVCTWTKDQIQRVSNLLSELCDSAVVCTAALDWMERHPGWTLLIQIGVMVIIPTVGAGVLVRGTGGPIGYMDDALKGSFQMGRTYKTSTGVDFKVPAFAKTKNVCHVSGGCGEWVPKELRDPKRMIDKADKERMIDAVCDAEMCHVGGKTFPRSEATVDHIIPWSCGGASTIANSIVMQRDENIAKAGCAPAGKVLY